MKRLLAPLWHPPEMMFAGGFYRAKRILESLHRYEIYAVASDTFPFEGSHVLRYPTRILTSNSPRLFGCMRALNWVWSALAMVALALRWRKNIDFVYASPSEILPVSLSALLVGKILCLPVILCNQNIRDTRLWPLNRLVHRSADAVVTVSEALADELRREKISAPIFVGTNGVDDFSLPMSALEYEAVFVGRHTAAKGIFDLLRAWRLVCNVLPKARLACAGSINPDMSKKLSQEVRLLNLVQNVVFLGSVDEEQKWRLYSCSHVCLFPSHVEGWGIVPIEAHLAGLPVIAFDLPAYAATIRNSPGARLVRDYDVESFARAAIELLSGPRSERPDLRDWARGFTWRAAAEREEEILQMALENVRANE